MVRGELLPEGDAVLGAHGCKQRRLGNGLLLDQDVDHPGAVHPGKRPRLGKDIGRHAQGR